VLFDSCNEHYVEAQDVLDVLTDFYEKLLGEIGVEIGMRKGSGAGYVGDGKLPSWGG